MVFDFLTDWGDFLLPDVWLCPTGTLRRVNHRVISASLLPTRSHPSIHPSLPHHPVTMVVYSNRCHGDKYSTHKLVASSVLSSTVTSSVRMFLSRPELPDSDRSVLFPFLSSGGKTAASCLLGEKLLLPVSANISASRHRCRDVVPSR